jgi:hypothetical protein
MNMRKEEMEEGNGVGPQDRIDNKYIRIFSGPLSGLKSRFSGLKMKT